VPSIATSDRQTAPRTRHPAALDSRRQSSRVTRCFVPYFLSNRRVSASGSEMTSGGGVGGDSRLRPRPVPPVGGEGAGDGRNAPAPCQRCPVRSRAIPTRGPGSRGAVRRPINGREDRDLSHRWHGRGGRPRQDARQSRPRLTRVPHLGSLTSLPVRFSGRSNCPVDRPPPLSRAWSRYLEARVPTLRAGSCASRLPPRLAVAL
jgi:hypothetical protein